ncbi:hypothetical protein LV476_02395 [Guyparkeria hydrothermalis]|uniref:chorismate transformation enzyme, FkbO/Hyg5 family n=1 Tax=Guyparkeria hydrothermalis TaxID=923 RepID=UPI002021352D|nr:hypothetical protein [Guyparkeria hydrothermalis]MCL7743803.1 hypothetical protein [Guyparkeria hydrothermalis]
MTDAPTSRDTASRGQATLLGALSLWGWQSPGQTGCVGELPLALLQEGPDQPIEAFFTNHAVETSSERGRCIATAPGFAFGVFDLDESAGLTAGTERAYRQLFDVLEQSGTPHLWRVWQYLPAINDTDPDTGQERYRLFNQGRADAFANAGRDATQSAPAACALGCAEGTRGQLLFLASDMPPRPIENPRQVSAYHYPREYGPRSPIFARAAVASGHGHDWLFISGTASITGHASRHVGDIRAQTDETLANLETVRLEANAARPNQASSFEFDGLALLRVYLRHPEDLAPVRERLKAWLSGPAEILYLQADICRSDLLVEIEATLRQPRNERASTDASRALL